MPKVIPDTLKVISVAHKVVLYSVRFNCQHYTLFYTDLREGVKRHPFAEERGKR